MKTYFKSLIQKSVVVHIRTGEEIMGTLAGFDEFYNVFLIECEGTQYIPIEADQFSSSVKAVNGRTEQYTISKSRMSDIWVRGDTIVTLGLK